MFCLSHFIISSWIIFAIKLKCNLSSPSNAWAFIKGKGMEMGELRKAATWPELQPCPGRGWPSPALEVGSGETSPHELCLWGKVAVSLPDLMLIKAHFYSHSLVSFIAALSDGQAGSTGPILQTRKQSWEKGLPSWGQVEAGTLDPTPVPTRVLLCTWLIISCPCLILSQQKFLGVVVLLSLFQFVWNCGSWGERTCLWLCS